MKVFAHRGYSGKYPENTMLAFAKAEEAGCDGIELDVQLTKDGTVVIIHDELVDRTTNGQGPVCGYTYDELAKLDAGKAFGGRYGFCPIPTLEEYLKWAAKTGLVTNVEIKSGVYYYEGLEEKTAALVRKYHMEDRVIYSSFNHLSLIRIREIEPEAVLGALEGRGEFGNAAAYCRQFGFAAYHPGAAGLKRQTIEDCHEKGIAVHGWTVNDMGTLERLREWGCDGIFTNYPGICQAWLKSGQERA